MKMTVGFNGDINLISQLAEYPVESLYSKMTSDMVGGGRSSFLLPEIKKSDISPIVQTAHKYNQKFYYLLNSSCMANEEYTRKYNNDLMQLIGFLSETGVDGIIVASPYLLDLIKKHFGHITVAISVFAHINSIQRARHWNDRGADRLILLPDINRNFELLKKIRQAVSCELEIAGNITCQHNCSYSHSHANSSSHSSSSKDKNGGFVIPFDMYNCTIAKLSDPAELLKSRWIRPEDLSVYEDLGINTLKLIDRMKNSDWILNTVKAYSEKKYDGNLVDLVPFPMIKSNVRDFQVNTDPGRIFKPRLIHPVVLKKQQNIKYPHIHIDNSKLNHFIDHFKKNNCEELQCGIECHYCEKKAEEVISYDKADLDRGLQEVMDLKNMLINRKAFERSPFFVYLISLIVRFFAKKKNTYR